MVAYIWKRVRFPIFRTIGPSTTKRENATDNHRPSFTSLYASVFDISLRDSRKVHLSLIVFLILSSRHHHPHISCLRYLITLKSYLESIRGNVLTS